MSTTPVMLADTLRRIRSAPDVSHLFHALGYVRDDQPLDGGTFLVATWRGFKVMAVSDRDPPGAARTLAHRLRSADGRALAVAVGPAGTELAVAAPRLGGGGVSRVLVVPLQHPSAEVLQHLSRFRPKRNATGLAHALRIDELLASEIAGERFFTAFRHQLDRMAESLTPRGTIADRRLTALLALTRVLFLYFVQAKGWLNGRTDFLRGLLDAALAEHDDFHANVLDPLLFETLNRPAAKRRSRRFGAIPYLNGGLFQPHPAERRIGQFVFSNALWRDAFDNVFERFRFCVREAHEVDAVAPDMLGRVFERVMDADSRNATGSFYTPESVVTQIVDATVETALLGQRTLPSEIVKRVVRCRPVDRAYRDTIVQALETLRVLDPAVGSGAFLLGALERLSEMQLTARGIDRDGHARLRVRRDVLRLNLFGVDINPMAVRLAELRLWLAVVADDPTTDIRRVEPLPNLDGIVRQGNSLLDPIGAGHAFGIGAVSPTSPQLRAVRDARVALFHTRGKRHAAALARLRRRETALAQMLLEASLGRTESALKDLAALARSRDLFGRRPGLSPTQDARYQQLRRQRADTRRALRAARDGVIPFFSYEVHTPDITRDGGFSIVVGNPPWVRAERLSARLRAALRGRFSWWIASTGRGYAHLPDLAVAFLQRAVELAMPRGGVGLLLPSKLVSAGYGEAARSHLVRETTIRYLHRMSDRESASFGATTYPLAMVVENQPPSSKHAVKLSFSGNPTLTQQSLTAGGPWVLAPDRARHAVHDFCASGRPLGVVAPGALGIKTGANGVFVGERIRSEGDVAVVRFATEETEIEASVLRGAIRGRDVGPFVTRGSRVLLWGYDEWGHALRHLPHKAARYVARHAEALRRRTDYRGGPLWTLFRLMASLAPHRVVWADIARRPNAVVLEQKENPRVVPLNTCYVSAAPDRGTAMVIAGVLNSTWTAALVSLTADEARGPYRRVNARICSPVPIPAPGRETDALTVLSSQAHEGHVTTQDELDEAVAEALSLPGPVREALRELATSHR